MMSGRGSWAWHKWNIGIWKGDWYNDCEFKELDVEALCDANSLQIRYG